MEEFVIITYPVKRPVYVNGNWTGYTNEVLRLGGGTHRFTIGPPEDCDPLFFECAVEGTSALLPMEIVFIQKG
jgi:hypothetical protein